MKMKVKCRCGNSITTNKKSVNCLKCRTSIDIDLTKRIARTIRDMNKLLKDTFYTYKKLPVKKTYKIVLDTACHTNDIPLELHEVVQAMYWYRRDKNTIKRPGLNWAYNNPIGEWGHIHKS